MVPLVTRQGLSVPDLKALAGGRRILVWGIGDMTLDVLTSLTKAGLRPQALLHSDATVVGGDRYGLPVLSSSDVLAATHSSEMFVVLAAPAFRRQGEEACIGAGLRKGVDFISFLSVPRPQAIVDVANDCSPESRGGFHSTIVRPSVPLQISANTFHKVVTKLDADLPLLSHIELALWGEPTRNPDLPHIIRLAQNVAPCTVASALPPDISLEPVIKAQPARFDITVAGFGETYEARVPGGSWADFTRQLAALRELIADCRPSTRFQVRLYRWRDDPPDLEGKWRQLLRSSGIALAPQTPYLMPYDLTLAYCESGRWPLEAQKVADLLPWHLQRTLDACLSERNRPCLSQRIFPIINADLSVGLCHLYSQPKVMPDYLSVSWDDLLEMRHKSEFCRRCQEFGLHRLDLDVMGHKYGNLTNISNSSGRPP